MIFLYFKTPLVITSPFPTHLPIRENHYDALRTKIDTWLTPKRFVLSNLIYKLLICKWLVICGLELIEAYSELCLGPLSKLVWIQFQLKKKSQWQIQKLFAGVDLNQFSFFSCCWTNYFIDPKLSWSSLRE